MRALAAALLVVLAGAGGPATSPGRNGRLAFASERGGSALGIFTVNPDGSGLRRVTGHPPFGVDPAWSPDGRRVAFDMLSAASGHELWVANANGTRPHRLLSRVGSDDLQIAWSPDGRRLAFVQYSARTRTDIWVVDADGRHRRRLIATRLSESEPAWSPDGSRIAYARQTGRTFSVFVASATGGPGRRLATGGEPAWSPDGRRIAFVRSRCPVCHYRLFVMDASGAHVRRLTPTADKDDGSPVWSPDGRMIAYAICCDEEGDRIGGALYLIRPDGSGQRRIYFGDDDVEHPTWSPDGRRLAFDVGDVRLYVIRSDGTGARSFFSPPPAVDAAPVWSPRGRKLAFIRNGYLWVMDPDGSAQRRIGFWFSASWAPDGNHVAAENEADGVDVVSLVDGHSTVILSDEGAGDTSKWGPAWSPDGRRIAYLDGDGYEGDVSLYTVSDGSTGSLGVTAEGGLSWSPDGARLLYDAHSRCGRSDCDAVFALDVATRRARLLARHASQAVYSPDGKQIAFVRGGDVYTMRADGRNVRRITRDPGPDLAPDWQPLP
jgi:TolB protein